MEQFEQHLLQGVNTNEKAAFDHLFDLYYRQLCFYANHFLQNPQDAEDIVVNCFCQLWQQDKNYLDFPHLRATLFTMTRHQCISHLRRENAKSIREKAYADLNAAPDGRVQEWMDTAEIIHELYQAIAQLPDKARTVFQLTYLDEHSRAEVAQMLGISENTVRNQNARAMALLRKILGERKMRLAILLLHFTLIEN